MLDPPMSHHASIDPPTYTPNLHGDMALLATATTVHHLLSQVGTLPQAVQGPVVVTPENLNTIYPSQLAVNPSQLIVEPSQTAVEPTWVVLEPSQPIIEPPQAIVKPSQAAVIKPSQVVVEPSQVVVEPSQATVEPPRVIARPPQAVVEPQAAIESSQAIPGYSKVSTETALVDTHPGSTVTPIPSQPPMRVTDTTNSPMPNASYWVRNPIPVPLGKPSRRDSIDGALEVIIDMINDEQEMVVDLRNYISMESDGDESHISSQKTTDGCRELLPPPDAQ